MKKFIAKIKSVIIGMMLFAAAVFSSFASPAEQRHNQQRFCSEVSSMAGMIMHQRQTGASLSVTLDQFDRMTYNNPTIRTLMRSIIMQAYSRPAYSTAEVRNREIREFENTQMLMCMKAFESRPLGRS